MTNASEPAPAPPAAEPLSAVVRETLRSLRHRSFRLFFFGQLFSMTGYWMQQTAQAWLVYRLTRSSLALGLVSFASMIPVLLFGLWGGVEADRRDKRRLIIATQLAAMAQAGVLAALTMTGRVDVWHVGLLAFTLGLINAFDMPARQSFFVEMVGRDDLPNAIALNSTMVNATRMIGPAAAGFVLAAAGEGPCFLINAASYAAVLWSLAAMSLPERSLPSADGSVFGHLRELREYLRPRPRLGLSLRLLASLSLLGMPYMVLMPVFADGVLGAGPRGLGLLSGASGLGAVAGALALARRRRTAGIEHRVATSMAVFGCGMILFALSKVFWLSLALIPIAGYGLMVSFAAINTLLQTEAADGMRGRLMSLFTVTFMGLAPFGSLAGGALAHRLGAPATLLICGAGCLAVASWYHRRVHGMGHDAVEVRLPPETAPGL